MKSIIGAIEVFITLMVLAVSSRAYYHALNQENFISLLSPKTQGANKFDFEIEHHFILNYIDSMDFRMTYGVMDHMDVNVSGLFDGIDFQTTQNAIP